MEQNLLKSKKNNSLPSAQLKAEEEMIEARQKWISESSVAKIYEITRMTVEFILEVDRQTIARFAKILAQSIKLKEDLKDENLLASVDRRLKRRAMREYLINWKLDLMTKYCEDPEGFVVTQKR